MLNLCIRLSFNWMREKRLVKNSSDWDCGRLETNFKNGPFPASFSLFLSVRPFKVNMFIIKFRRWLDSNRGPLALEATALPTEPQPLSRHLMLGQRSRFLEWRPLIFYFFSKWAILGLFFILFCSFSNKQYKFYNTLCEKMSIQYLVLGIRTHDLLIWVSSFNL